jgi:hypothetical protein
MSNAHKKCCHYLGTEVSRKWWSRYKESNFLQCGIGDFWFEDHALMFQRYKKEKPIAISYDEIFHIRIGKWHSRRWGSGAPVVKIDWDHEDMVLSSGFIFSRDGLETVGILQKLEAASKRHRKPEMDYFHAEPAT